MTTADTRSVIVERTIPYPPETLWRALTQPHLIEKWIGMKTDFASDPGHKFSFIGEWGSVDCHITQVEPPKTLAYSWAAFGLESIVTWTLTPTGTSTHLRMEQSGFRADQDQFYQGAASSWPNYVETLEKVASTLD